MWFSSLEFDAQKYLMNFALGYSTNDILIMISSLLSYGTAFCLANIFYYVGGTMHGLFAIACGVIHALHFGYTLYNNYMK
ncbi:unnamed protein product [Ixodes hexagonus]